ncbi:hypothetical protein [Bradyrhizobium erythrophlei]|jgi:hypothetical protein|nr:hypothetical protein [Bradyrhizobium erythrophlei]
MAVQRNLVIFAALALAGCGAMPNLSLPDVKARNDFKGKPLSVVTAQLGNPDGQQTVNRQKIYTWRRGQALQDCLISVVMTPAGDVVESYGTSGDAAICSPYLAPAEPVSAQ